MLDALSGPSQLVVYQFSSCIFGLISEFGGLLPVCVQAHA